LVFGAGTFAAIAPATSAATGENAPIGGVRGFSLQRIGQLWKAIIQPLLIAANL
jgi:hypothetical protein